MKKNSQKKYCAFGTKMKLYLRQEQLRFERERRAECYRTY